MILLILLIIVAIVGWEILKKTECNISGIIAGTLGLLSGAGFIVMIIGLVIIYTDMDITIATNKARYDVLKYKAQTESVRDQFGLLNKDYIDEIQEWNEYVAKWKAGTENLWIGIIYPNKISDSLEFIDLQSFEGRK